jgi:pimeloyl-ACP methyl ester carboxylesterase
MKAVRESLNNRQAVVFLHGFSDHQGGVWNLFPDLIGKMCPGWNVYSLSYDTSFLPDIFGFWETDPDIPLLSQWFNGVLSYGVIPKHDRLAIVAHSMGGLVVQRAILDFPAIRAKLGHLFLFGTPSAGLRVATFLQFWNRQIGNMAEGGNFIQSLRADWNRIIGDFPSFCLHVVAGMKDGFVPPFTSLDPFPRHFHRLVKGNHREMVKARNEDHPAVQLVANVLPLNCVYGPETKDTLLPVLSQWSPESLLAKVNTLGPTPVHGQVSALAVSLDGAGMRPEAIELLKRHLDLHPDVRGTLGGRLKRKWIEERDHDAAADAVRLYYEAYVRSTQEMRDGLQPSEIEEQGYYHAINLAFF